MLRFLRSHDEPGSRFETLRAACGADWVHIREAARLAKVTTSAVEAALAEDPPALTTDAASFVVFGSLARAEYTAGSDLDWSLLVDAAADPGHLGVAQQIRRRLDKGGLKPPGPTETFGKVTFSHTLVHSIGGDADTNANTTRRMLLLLESVPVGPPEAHERVVRGVINRYLEDLQDPAGSNLAAGDSPEANPIARFLLNDMVRFWRTMAVDYAGKRRERADRGWAIRNLKLRLSRKLLFTVGLLMVFDLSRHALEAQALAMNQRLFELVRMTPIELLADQLLIFDQADLGRQLLNAYDAFLGVLGDPSRREHLDELSRADASNDAVFQDVRRSGQAFDQALQRLFFDVEPLGHFTRRFGLF